MEVGVVDHLSPWTEGRGEGVWRVGWQPSYHMKAAVRKKQSGRREDAQQARGQGPRPMFWVRGGDGRAKLASKPCCLAATAGNVLSGLHVSLCAAGPWTRGIPVGLPWKRYEDQPGSAGQTWWAGQLVPLPCGCVPRFSQLGFSQLSVGTFTE